MTCSVVSLGARPKRTPRARAAACAGALMGQKVEELQNDKCRFPDDLIAEMIRWPAVYLDDPVTWRLLTGQVYEHRHGVSFAKLPLIEKTNPELSQRRQRSD